MIMVFHWVIILCGGQRAVPVGGAAQAVLRSKLRMLSLTGCTPFTRCFLGVLCLHFLLCGCCWVLLLVRQSYVHFFLDKKVPKKSRLCIVSPACSIRGRRSGRGRTGKARIPRISKLALVVIALRCLGWVACCFCGLSAWFLAQTLICFTGILAFPVLNATRPGGKPGAAVRGLQRRGRGASGAGGRGFLFW